MRTWYVWLEHLQTGEREVCKVRARNERDACTLARAWWGATHHVGPAYGARAFKAVYRTLYEQMRMQSPMNA